MYAKANVEWSTCLWIPDSSMNTSILIQLGRFSSGEEPDAGLRWRWGATPGFWLRTGSFGTAEWLLLWMTMLCDLTSHRILRSCWIAAPLNDDPKNLVIQRPLGRRIPFVNGTPTGFIALPLGGNGSEWRKENSLLILFIIPWLWHPAPSWHGSVYLIWFS